MKKDNKNALKILGAIKAMRNSKRLYIETITTLITKTKTEKREVVACLKALDDLKYIKIEEPFIYIN